MAEPRGRPARWQTAMMLVPGAAVTFGAAVAWAAGSTPTSTSSPSTPQPVTHAADRVVRVQAAAYRRQLEKQLHDHRRNAHRLRHELAVLRTRTRRLGEVSVALPGPVAPVVGAPAPQAPVVAPPPPVVVAPPPPPPVHTVTGASGHP